MMKQRRDGPPENEEGRPALEAVGGKGGGERCAEGKGVGRDREQERLGLRPFAKRGDDLGQEQRLRIDGLGAADVDEREEVELVIGERAAKDAPGELGGVGNARIPAETVEDHRPLVLGEETGLLGEVVDEPGGKAGDDDGEQTLNDKLQRAGHISAERAQGRPSSSNTHDPRPAELAADAAHPANGVAEDATATQQREPVK